MLSYSTRIIILAQQMMFKYILKRTIYFFISFILRKVVSHSKFYFILVLLYTFLSYDIIFVWNQCYSRYTISHETICTKAQLYICFASRKQSSSNGGVIPTFDRAKLGRFAICNFVYWKEKLKKRKSRFYSLCKHRTERP